MNNYNKSRRDFIKKTALGTTVVGLSAKGYADLKLVNKGPYFGNGLRNGWADQNSI